MPTIQTPDGPVDFPDSMKDADIEAVLQKQYGAPKSSVAGAGALGTPQPITHPPVSMGTFPTIREAIDRASSDQPLEPGKNELSQRFAAHAVRGTLGALNHPLDTIKSIGATLPMSPNYDPRAAWNANPIVSTVKSIRDNGLAKGVAGVGGDLAAGQLLGEVGGKVVPPLADAASSVGGAIKNAAIGDTDAAALRGLQVGPKSPKALGTIQSVEGARPFLQGAQDLEDLQGKIKPAKAEIWKPYADALDAIGDRPVNGPDGPTTVRELEAERLQLSAINRGLKGKVPNPESVQLAQQKGLTQAQALAKESAVKAALDPELASTGINPTAIRKAFGQVADIGGKVSGKSTLIEPPQPSGFGKIANLSIKQPLQAPAQIAGGLRDLLAGRPLYSAKPTDLGIREGFANAGPKPDFGSVTTTGQPAPPRGLLGAGAIEMPPPMEGTPTGNTMPFRYDTDPMRLGRMLPESVGAGAIEMPPPMEGTPTGNTMPFRYDTDPMRLGRMLPESVPSRDLPLSSYHEIFPNQLPAGKLLDMIRETRKK
jgi:hypothetical protein